MAVQYSFGKIVTDGLVLALDAADRNSYVSGSLTWRDVAGSNNGTLTNGPTFNTGSLGSIVFDGTNDYVQLSGSGINVGVTFTVQTWVRVGKFGGYNQFGFNRGSIITNSYPYSSNQGFWICCTSQGSPAENYAPIQGRERFFISIGNDQYGATSFTGSLTPYTQSWFNIAARVDGTNPIKLYINGLPVSSYESNHQTNGPSSLNYNGGPCSLGTRDSVAEYLSGSISALGMYNRALTDSEVLQNYNAQKSRFGLV